MADSPEQVSQGNGDVYTMAEAARLKGVSYHTVSRAVRRGKLPAQRLGRMALIAAEDLRGWRPMRERAPHKYRRREPNPEAAPALLDLASGDRLSLASRLATLLEIVHGATAEQSLAEFLALLADRFASAMGLRRVSIWGIEPGSGKATRLASFGPPFSMVPIELGLGAESGEGSSHEPAVITNVPAEFGVAADDLLNVNQVFLVPLRVAGRQVGMLVGDNNGGSFSVSQDQRVLAQGLASQAALAIERDQLQGGSAGGDQGLALLDRLPVAIVGRDGSGTPVFANAEARQVLGLSSEEVRGSTALRPLAQMTGSSQTVQLRRSDGTGMAMAVEIRSAGDAAGAEIATLAVLRPTDAVGTSSGSRDAEPARR